MVTNDPVLTAMRLFMTDDAIDAFATVGLFFMFACAYTIIVLIGAVIVLAVLHVIARAVIGIFAAGAHFVGLTVCQNSRDDPSNKPAFDSALVARLLDPDHMIVMPEAPRVMFMGIDPASGGLRSEYTWMTLASVPDRRPGKFGDRFFVVGAEAGIFDTPSEVSGLMHQHIAALHRAPGLELAQLVVAPESNLGWEHAWIVQELRRSGMHDDVCIMAEDRGRIGMRTTNYMKNVYWRMMDDILRDDKLHFSDTMVTIGSGNSPAKMRDRLVGELKDYMKIVLVPKPNSQAEPVVTFNGKKGKNGFDDMVMATQIAAGARNAFYSPANADKYATFLRRAALGSA
jgi:hypothetical protein